MKLLLKTTSTLVLILIMATSVHAQKKRLAVFDFRVTSGVTSDVAVTLTNKFRNEMARTLNYTMVERSAMEQVLSEQRFSASDLADQDKAVQLGKLLSASQVVVGDIGKIGQTYSIVVRLIDVETASIENSESLEYRGEQDGLLTEFEILAPKLAGTYVEKKKRGWLYITGVAVIGGAVTSVLYLSGDSGGESGLPLPPSPPGN
ncbi:MAG: CsgG/HfaB family protein [Balneolaceae bacterium]